MILCALKRKILKIIFIDVFDDVKSGFDVFVDDKEEII